MLNFNKGTNGKFGVAAGYHWTTGWTTYASAVLPAGTYLSICIVGKTYGSWESSASISVNGTGAHSCKTGEDYNGADTNYSYKTITLSSDSTVNATVSTNRVQSCVACCFKIA